MSSTHRLPTLGLAFALFVALFYATAWVTEDAFITLRVVDNWLGGHGLIWNPGERVQVYTHPLWLLLLAPLVALVGDAYAATLLLCAMCSLGALLLLASLPARSSIGALLALAALPFSKAFTDYLSSGLENPLTHLLLGLFVWRWLCGNSERRRLIELLLLASLLYLSRPDAVLLVAAPCAALLLAQAREQGLRSLLRPLLLGLLPALLWSAFALFYYGSPLPNTALAKVGTGVGRVALAAQAWSYLQHTLMRDPFTLLLILGVALQGLRREWRAVTPFAISLLLWLAYLFVVGADYMEGRFLSAAFFLACCMLASQLTLQRSQWPMLLAMALLALLSLRTLPRTLLSALDYQDRHVTAAGIADERGFYYSTLGLRPVLASGDWKTHRWFRQADRVPEGPGLYIRCAIGMIAFRSDRQAYWVDPIALSDAFLSRLPARSGARIGHAERALPPGYLSALLGDPSKLAPALRRLFDDVSMSTRGALTDPERLGAIWRLNTGAHREAAQAFDREAIGLPGVAVTSRDQFSCLGIPNGFEMVWRVGGTPQNIQLSTAALQTAR